MKQSKLLCLLLSLSLIATSAAKADAIYVTNDVFDPELSQFKTLDQPWKYWEGGPGPGIFMPIDDFKEVASCLRSCKDLEVDGLDTLPRTALVDPGPHFSPEVLYFLVGLVAGGLIGHTIGSR